MCVWTILNNNQSNQNKLHFTDRDQNCHGMRISFLNQVTQDVYDIKKNQIFQEFSLIFLTHHILFHGIFHLFSFELDMNSSSATRFPSAKSCTCETNCIHSHTWLMPRAWMASLSYSCKIYQRE